MPELLLGPELFRITIPGQPAGAGSKTAIPVTRGRGGPLVFRKPPKIAGGQVWGQPMLNYTHNSKFTEPWMHKVEAMAGAKRGAAKPLDGALWINLSFYEERPDGHFFSDGHTLRPDAPAWPHQTSTHDVDKLRRAISDSLTNAHVLADDKRVIGGGHWKLYADKAPYQACAVIVVGAMAQQTVEEAGIESPPPPGQETLA